MPARDRPAVPRLRPGGRSSVVREAVLTAAREQLLDGGYTGLSLSSVARRAGVAVSTVSRRWPQSSDLLADVILGSALAPVLEAPDAGAVQEDLRSIAVAALRQLEVRGQRMLLRSLLALPEPKFDSVRRTVWESHTAAGSTAVRRAIARGELPWQVDPQHLSGLVIGAIWMAELVVGAPVEEQWLDELVASAVMLALAAARAAPGSADPPVSPSGAPASGIDPELTLRPFESVGITLLEDPQPPAWAGRSALLDAAARELLDVGFEAITMTGVARAAGVANSTVHRRWPTKAALVSDVVIAVTADAVVVPDLGSLRAEAEALATGVASALESQQYRAVVRSMLALTPDEAQAIRGHLWRSRAILATAIVDRAVERKEARADGNLRSLLALLVGPIWMRALVGGAPFDRAAGAGLGAVVALAASTAAE